MSAIDKIKKDIMNNKIVLQQLEGVLKTTADELQKKRVAKEIKEMKKKIKEMEVLLNDISGDAYREEDDEDERYDSYRLLTNIQIEWYNKHHNDREMDALISYLNFFEMNYLPILSEYYIKLDFNHSLKRDSYYTKYLEIKKILKEYDYELDILYNDEYNRIALHHDKSLIYKIRYQFMLEVNNYFRDLRGFIQTLLNDYQTGGNIILNPDEKIELSEFEENRKLDGYNVISALEEIHKFCDEIIKFLSIPLL